MQVHFGFDQAIGIKNPVVTTGSFDGVHIGHKTILNRINEIAKNIDGESVLITFYPHPRKVLYPETAGKDLMFISSQKEKIELLRKAGLNHLIIVKFTLDFSRTSSEEFIRDILIKKLGAKFIVVGFNHHFGHNRQGDYEYLYNLSKELNFGVEEIPEQDIQHETVSSSTIRKAIKDGRIQRANAYLDHQYIIIGGLGKGTHIFNDINFPTLTVQIEEAGKLIPPDGVYAVAVHWNDSQYKAMAIVWREQNEDVNSEIIPSVELHLLDFDSKFHDDEATIYFQKQIFFVVDMKNKDILRKQLSLGQSAVNDLIY
ncbi:MAG: riboflavin biosynthesis protein RibF [Bacteroidetes bacterium HGW-Bacteroidetes-15]|nr:MAG: riboflavin biosynthesis protein RibF [Bacteroidetes bacterium HGW-Bacteroidetes-15]